MKLQLEILEINHRLDKIEKLLEKYINQEARFAQQIRELEKIDTKNIRFAKVDGTAITGEGHNGALDQEGQGAR